MVDAQRAHSQFHPRIRSARSFHETESSLCVPYLVAINKRVCKVSVRDVRLPKVRADKVGAFGDDALRGRREEGCKVSDVAGGARACSDSKRLERGEA